MKLKKRTDDCFDKTYPLAVWRVCLALCTCIAYDVYRDEVF